MSLMLLAPTFKPRATASKWSREPGNSQARV